MPHPSSNQRVHLLADMITENWLQLLASNEALEVRPWLTVVANLTGGGSILDVRKVGHCVTNSDSPQGSRRQTGDVGLDLQNLMVKTI